MSQLLVPRRAKSEPSSWRSTSLSLASAPDPDANDASRIDRRKRDSSLSCIVPCYNEAANLDTLLLRLLDAVSALVDDWEIILVDDGSSDDTPQLLARWSRYQGVRSIQLSRNFGKEAALSAGLQAARGDVVVMLDADLQHEPELIAEMLRKWREGADMVYAVRLNRKDEKAYKRLGARLFYNLVNAADRFEVPAGAGDFRLMDRQCVDALLALPERNRFMKGLYAWVGFTTAAVPYTPAARAHGSSRFRPWQLLRLSLDGLTSFTTWPLRAVSLVGVSLAIVALLYGAFLTLEYLLYGHDIGGWTTIVVSLMLFAGIQMISLGVVGEYVGRIFEECKGRPLFVVKRELGRGLNKRTGP